MSSSVISLSQVCLIYYLAGANPPIRNIQPNSFTVSQRGVVFFRKQDNITNDLQKELVQRLGELSGKPSTSKLHIHPVMNSARAEDKDDED